jgi:hypothetical protein
MHHYDYESILYGEDGEHPLKPTVLRCLQECKDDEARLKVEIRCKPLGTTGSKAEHQFVVDGDPELGDMVIASIKERLEAAPGDGYEGQIRMNFYQNGNTSVKYGSYSRQMRQAPADTSYQSQQSNPMMNMMNTMISGNQNEQEDFGGMDGSEYNENESPFDEPVQANNEGNTNNFDPKQMQQMMQLMQMMGGNNSPVDNKMAMDWLSHTMSFLFRSLSLQMSMFERSTKLVEIYAMRFGLPQPLERPNPERIIREVPMELDFPQYQPPPKEESSGFSLLPQLLNAAAAFAGNPGAAQLLQTAAGLAQGAANKTAPAQHPPQHPQHPQHPQKRRRPPQQRKEDPQQSRYVKQSPPQPKKPVDGADDFTWEQKPESPSKPSEFSFGLDGSHSAIDPFEHTSEDEHPEHDEEHEFNEFNPHDDQDEMEMPEGFPDLTGMSADEMKRTVIEWVEADPNNRKQQVLEMLPELSSILM